MNRIVSSSTCATIVLLGVATAAFSQNNTSPTRLPTPASRVTSTPTPAASSAGSEDAEREKIWNSPTMLRARAWVQEYCQRSAKITPAEAQQYMHELESLSPVQMKLWLMKFDHEEESIRQQQADFNRTRQVGLNQAHAMNRATEREYADINQDETEAAENEEQSLQVQQEQTNQRVMARQDITSEDAASATSALGPLGGYGYYGAYGGWGGGGLYSPAIHIHVHP